MREVTKIKIRHKDNLVFIETNNEELIAKLRSMELKEDQGTLHFKKFICDPSMIEFKQKTIL